MEEFVGKEIDGHYVRPMMQRVWEAQLDVVRAIDMICRKHSLTWFAAWGTLLGAVRHKGYIPWDDDIDIGMRRLDFEKFKRYAPKELPKGYTFNLNRDGNMRNLAFTVKTGSSIITDESYLNSHHGCPYPVGVDIFVFDNVPDDPVERQDYVGIFSHAGVAAQTIEPGMTYADCDQELRDLIDTTEQLTGVHLDKTKALQAPLMILSDQIAAMYYDVKTEHIAIAGCLTWNIERYSLKREWFDKIIKLPFGSGQMNCPVEYDEILKRCYGENYMTPVEFHNHEHSFIQQEQVLHEAYISKGLEIPEIFRE